MQPTNSAAFETLYLCTTCRKSIRC